MGLLEFGLASVFHELCVSACEHHETVAPFGVAQAATAQQHFVVVERARLTTLPSEHAFELVEQLVGRLALYGAVEAGHFVLDACRAFVFRFGRR